MSPNALCERSALGQRLFFEIFTCSASHCLFSELSRACPLRPFASEKTIALGKSGHDRRAGGRASSKPSSLLCKEAHTGEEQAPHTNFLQEMARHITTKKNSLFHKSTLFSPFFYARAFTENIRAANIDPLSQKSKQDSRVHKASSYHAGFHASRPGQRSRSSSFGSGRNSGGGGSRSPTLTKKSAASSSGSGNGNGGGDGEAGGKA